MIRIGIMMTDLRASSLEEYVRTHPQLDLTFKVSGLDSLRAALIVKGAPDILLLHLPKPDDLDLQDIFSVPRKMQTIALVDDYSDFKCESFSKVRPKGFFLVGHDWALLGDAIESVRFDGGFISPRIAAKLIEDIQQDPLERYRGVLTSRELEIIKLACEGLSYKEIAEKLFITSFTVNQHLKKVYVKMHVRSKGELISKVLGAQKMSA